MALKQELTKISLAELLDHSSSLFKTVNHYQNYPEKPIHISTSSTIQEALKCLADNRITSAPIYDPEAQEFIGSLEYTDLVGLVLDVLGKVPMNERAELDWTLGDILEKTAATETALKAIAAKRPLHWLSNEATLWDCLELFVKTGVFHAKKAHRVAVMDDKYFVGVVSQSFLAAVVASEHGIRGDKAKSWPTGQKSIKDLGIIKTDFMSVTETDTVMDALFRMHQFGTSSVAIMKHNQFYGSISMSDVKVILGKPRGYKRLFQTSLSFFKEMRIEQSMEHEGKAILPVFSVGENEQLVNVMEKMVATKTHRMWVADSTEKICGLVSLSAIIPLLAQ